jgi:hypothetical protein
MKDAVNDGMGALAAYSYYSYCRKLIAGGNGGNGIRHLISPLIVLTKG